MSDEKKGDGLHRGKSDLEWWGVGKDEDNPVPRQPPLVNNISLNWNGAEVYVRLLWAPPGVEVKDAQEVFTFVVAHPFFLTMSKAIAEAVQHITGAEKLKKNLFVTPGEGGGSN